ncbi:hypothetical protein M409DRAFT_29124 [Zasmidium cellare ATCC 36951]|uniref:Methyltransferase domain-containing protein n=1 Tax=Zasmidium cellare ATCC 36951 TaxID=1080233 RepID=A0A6A6C0W6_ZASCE|nr:uncharacterized protein M409DRAFT_29124 [Zasmidium cellare ATCC 36951]KAF2160503.1 hypothetical protein M409DRAFT_29124 [Zasmidium cellare ATCC 36951]
MAEIQNGQHEYNGPHSSEENTRLDFQHNALRTVMGNKTLHATLPSPPTKILDIGCGTGVVTLELAEKFPSAEIIAIDIIKPIHPIEKLKNVRFLQGKFADFIADGTLQPASFDYIFSRLLILGITDWKAQTSRVFNLLRPGTGIYEAQDLSWNIFDKEGQVVFDQFPIFVLMVENAAAKGLDTFCGDHHPKYLGDAGFEDVQHESFPWTLQYWPERPETYALSYMFQEGGSKAFRMTVLDKLLGESGRYTSEQMETYKAGFEKMAQDFPEGTHQPFSVTWGRKPA